MLSLQEVITDIEESKKKRDAAGMMSDINKDIYKKMTDGHFEAVLTGIGDEKCLIPEEVFPFYLYRGQNEEFIPCVPSLYRGKATEPDIFLNRMRLVEFKHLLDSYPIVDGFFKKNHFVVDVEGLAQHYGLKTSVLDLTRNLDIAIFFAVCKYNSNTDSYEYFNDNEPHTGIIYVFDPIFDNEPIPNNDTDIYNGNIRPIGLQPFRRPAAQKGFSVHIKKGNSIKCYIYKFTFTCKDSKRYYDMFDQGNRLWIKDELVDKAKAISIEKDFSFKTFNEAYFHFKPKGFSKKKLMKQLKEDGIIFGSRATQVRFSLEEKENIITRWNKSSGKEFADSIVRKPSFDHEGVDKYGAFKGIKNRKDFRNLHMISFGYNLLLIASPDKPIDSEWVNYMNTPAPKKNSKEHGEMVPAHCTNLFGKTYLTEEDWKIK
ncbi:FRG domain-containing protein [Hallella mizrahii]|uniref:FRG domain-containing protein n=1 Tax=Hallella mizrahii TaxID=2606637 RepID=A0A7K0KJX6_9BACT|nr:FRG domain-containing protein [Hallella mizrahii]MST85770.1 FRG domain-containing protein [Hallella mizrahii]